MYYMLTFNVVGFPTILASGTSPHNLGAELPDLITGNMRYSDFINACALAHAGYRAGEDPCVKGIDLLDDTLNKVFVQYQED